MLEEIKEKPQWVVAAENKKPINPRSGLSAKPNDPSTWGTFKEAASSRKRLGEEYIGFVLSPEDDYICIDIDNALENRERTDEIVSLFSSYTEISKSGKGIHIFIKGSFPENLGKKNLKKNGIEVYSENHYIIVTGNLYKTEIGEEYSEIREADYFALLNFFEKYNLIENLIEEETKKPEKTGPKKKIPEKEIFERAKKAPFAEKFFSLFNGNWEEFFSSQSEADCSLCAYLLILTKGNTEQTDSLFRKSALFREKWDEKHGEDTYGNMTIEKALESYKEEEKKSAILGEMNDLCDAKRLFEQLNGNCIYNKTSKSFLFWNGFIWEEDDSKINYYTEKAREALFSQIKEIQEEKIKAEWLKYYKSTGNERKIKAMWSLLSGFDGITAREEDLDAHPDLLNTEGGLIDLSKGDPVENAREKLCTRVTVLGKEGGCPLWKGFLEETFLGDSEIIEYIQKALGYSLSGSCEERVFFICFGDGRNGKSTLFEILKGVLKSYAKSADNKIWARKRNPQENLHALAMLKGARIAFGSESSASDSIDEAFLKSITGNETIIARHLYQKSFEYKPEFTLWIGTNHKPTIRNIDQALIDRMRLLPFFNRVEEEDVDKTLAARILKEESGEILYWLVEGYFKYKAEGLSDPPTCAKEKADYILENDDVQRFLNDTLDRSGEDLFTPYRDVYGVYSEWSLEEGQRPNSSKWFSKKMSEKGYKTVLKKWGGRATRGYMLSLIRLPKFNKNFIAE